jgi:hypothetical protein
MSKEVFRQLPFTIRQLASSVHPFKATFLQLFQKEKGSLLGGRAQLLAAGAGGALKAASVVFTEGWAADASTGGWAVVQPTASARGRRAALNRFIIRQLIVNRFIMISFQREQARMRDCTRCSAPWPIALTTDAGIGWPPPPDHR